MSPKPVAPVDAKAFRQLSEVRAAALEHARQARKLSARRKELIVQLLGAGYAQADIARELGVTRQAIQKMLKLG